MSLPAGPPTSESRTTGASQLPGTLRLAGLAWGVMLVQEVALYARPTPYGGAYVDHWSRYLFHAALYNLLGVMLVTAPVLLLWVACYRKPIPLRLTIWVRRILFVLLAVTVMLDQVDNELMRFMGTHLTLSLARTYGKVGAWGADFGRSLAEDRGGPGLPFFLLAASPLILWWIDRWSARRLRSTRSWSAPLSLCVAVLALAVPLLAYQNPHGRFRRARVQPEILTLLHEIGNNAAEGVPPVDLAGIVHRYQAGWLQGDATGAWRFSADSTYPLLREPRDVRRGPDTPPWNVIYLQLESFRGWDVGFLRPDRARSPTPFLDSLAADGATAYWTRALSFGPPTVSGFIAGHCSIGPHSRHDITTTFTFTRLDCLPAALRQRGWHTAFFTGTDPDWDNQTPWLDRWFDERHFYRDANEADRPVFRNAAQRLRELGRSGAPFFATIVSISNHYPFHSREAALDLTPSREAREAILNTMHYTDDVVREFLRGFAGEPWFARTLVVVAGDHGYNLGEHGTAAGMRTGWRESLWIPLLIHGAHPRLVAGPHREVASLLDVAPTLADLLGVSGPTSWQGQSLLVSAPGRVVSAQRADLAFAESDRFSLVVDPLTGAARLYEARTDPLQLHDVEAAHPEVVAALTRRAAEEQALTDYLLEVDRVWFRDRDRPRGGRRRDP